jgi:hypothetical protein
LASLISFNLLLVGLEGGQGNGGEKLISFDPELILPSKFQKFSLSLSSHFGSLFLSLVTVLGRPKIAKSCLRGQSAVSRFAGDFLSSGPTLRNITGS